MTTRSLELEGCRNFRDLGGYPAAKDRTVRWRTLYRSDALHHLTLRDQDRVRYELGVRTTIDLRTEREVEAYPEPSGLGCRHHLPFHTTLPQSEDEDYVKNIVRRPKAMADRHLQMLERAGERVVGAALRILTEPSALPAVFYCAVGEGRTGVLAAVILGLLGVSDEQIVRDYTLSSQAMERAINRLRGSTVYGPGLDDVPASYFLPYPETMTLILEGLKTHHGSIEGYVRSLGVTEDTIERLRNTLLED